MVRLRSVLVMLAAAGLAAALGGARAPDGPASQTFDAKGVKIHYLVQGQGEPVVLIHGLYSSAELNWNVPGVISALAKDHQVIALDLPGYGQSDKPDTKAAYGLQMVEDVVLLLDHLKVKKAHVVGYSMGGIVALKLIVEHPDRVLSGVLGGMGWLREGSALQRSWERMRVPGVRRTPAVCVHSIAKLALTAEQVKAIRVPVEIVIGDRDPTKRLYVAPLAGVRKDWPVVEIKGAGHVDCIAKKEFRDELSRWLAAHAEK